MISKRTPLIKLVILPTLSYDLASSSQNRQARNNLFLSLLSKPTLHYNHIATSFSILNQYITCTQARTHTSKYSKTKLQIWHLVKATKSPFLSQPATSSKPAPSRVRRSTTFAETATPGSRSREAILFDARSVVIVFCIRSGRRGRFCDGILLAA